jgi:hypothetical protein
MATSNICCDLFLLPPFQFQSQLLHSYHPFATNHIWNFDESSGDIKSWDIKIFFVVYQTFTSSQIGRLSIVTVTSLSYKI